MIDTPNLKKDNGTTPESASPPNQPVVETKATESGRKFTGHMRWNSGKLEQQWEVRERVEVYHDGRYYTAYYTEKYEWLEVPEL